MNASDKGKSSSNDYFASLCDQIVACFDKEELKGLCFELGLPYDTLSGENTVAKARELIMYFRRRRKLVVLVEKCEQLRPETDWSVWKTTLPELGIEDSYQKPDPDRDLFEFLRIVFSRPAFRGPVMVGTPREPLKSAIDLTLQAVNTGSLCNRHGIELRKYEGLTRPADKELQRKMEEIQTRLHRASVLAAQFERGDVDHLETSKAIDNERDEIITILNGMLARFDIPPLPIPTKAEI